MKKLSRGDDCEGMVYCYHFYIDIVGESKAVTGFVKTDEPIDSIARYTAFQSKMLEGRDGILKSLSLVHSYYDPDWEVDEESDSA